MNPWLQILTGTSLHVSKWTLAGLIGTDMAGGPAVDYEVEDDAYKQMIQDHMGQEAYLEQVHHSERIGQIQIFAVRQIGIRGTCCRFLNQRRRGGI